MRLYLSMTRSRICARRKYIPPLFLSFLFSKPYYYVNTWLAQGLVSTRGRFNVVSTHLYNNVYTYKRYVQLNISAWFIELSKNAGSSQSSWRTLILDSYPRATLTHFSLQISVPLLRFFLLLTSFRIEWIFRGKMDKRVNYRNRESDWNSRNDCPFNSFVYVTRKISETKARVRGGGEEEEGDQDGISMTADRLGELRQIHLSFALQTDSADRSDRICRYFK